jgi:hypothetical protein
MARKQSLANKRRSQKNRNKSRNNKRARTIRSMRQVNGGGWFSLRSKVVPVSDQSSVLQPLLSDQSSVLQPLLSDQSSVLQPILQPLLASSSVPSDNVKSIISNQKYNDNDFDNYLKKILYLYNPELKLRKYIENIKNTAVVVTPLKKIIQDEVKNVLTYFTLAEANLLYQETLQVYNDFIQLLNEKARNSHQLILNLNMLFFELVLFAKMNIPNSKKMLNIEDNIEDEITFCTFTAIITLNTIFGLDPAIVSPSTETIIDIHLDDIKQKMKEENAALSAGGGSKGKMRRPKSRTRKL